MSCSRTVETAAKWYEESAAVASDFKSTCPDVARGFGTLFATVMKEGALSALQKELIALGIGLATRCEHCIYSHVQKCLTLGATREQVLDVAGVAVMMGGGPVYTYVPVLISAIEACEQAKVGSA